MQNKTDAVEEIKDLKALYCQSIDRKDWHTFETLFHDDAVMETGRAPNGGQIHGPKAITEYVRGRVADIPTSHHASVPLIEVTSESSARGSWAAHYAWGGGVLVGYGFYDESYTRADGRWRISRWRLQTTVQWGSSSASSNSVTRDTSS